MAMAGQGRALLSLVLLCVAGPLTAAAMHCRLRTAGTDYPVMAANSPGVQKFTVNFNATWQQANYVAYISTAGSNRCADCEPGDTVCKDRVFRSVSYSALVDGDYTGSGYSRGHLVPRTDLGCTTMVISNAVPMLSDFNGGVWLHTEEAIRSSYAGLLTLKGCEYVPNRYYRSESGRLLYLPTGCYFAVFDETSLAAAATTAAANLKLVAYSYCEQSSKACVERLPEWLDCGGMTPTENTLVSLAVIAVLVLAAVAAYFVQKRRLASRSGAGYEPLMTPNGDATAGEMALLSAVSTADEDQHGGGRR